LKAASSRAAFKPRSGMKRTKQILHRLIRKVIPEPISRKPARVIIETTNRCNLNCPFCLVGMQNNLMNGHGNVAHDLMTREMGMMSPETFKRVRAQLKSFGIKSALLHFQGEPFLNKHTPEFARQLKTDGLYVGVFTNGQAFSDKIIKRIAQAEIDLIRFSVDGVTENTYQQNRVGGKFKNVYENMKKLVAAHNDKKTRIEWQFLPLKNNEHEVETAKRLADEIGVHFFLKGYRVTDPELAPDNKKLRSSFLKKPCTDIYQQLGIYWKGDVVPCCYDVDGHDIMGNILNDDLQAIWQNEKYTEFRSRVDKVLRSPSDEPEICKSCLRWK
jgi:radical SAM protein with 4Fe4S-binding SPASM domain